MLAYILISWLWWTITHAAVWPGLSTTALGCALVAGLMYAEWREERRAADYRRGRDALIE